MPIKPNKCFPRLKGTAGDNLRNAIILAPPCQMALSAEQGRPDRTVLVHPRLQGRGPSVKRSGRYEHRQRRPFDLRGEPSCPSGNGHRAIPRAGYRVDDPGVYCLGLRFATARVPEEPRKKCRHLLLAKIGSSVIVLVYKSKLLANGHAGCFPLYWSIGPPPASARP